MRGSPVHLVRTMSEYYPRYKLLECMFGLVDGAYWIVHVPEKF